MVHAEATTCVRKTACSRYGKKNPQVIPTEAIEVHESFLGGISGNYRCANLHGPAILFLLVDNNQAT
jgi:hypothetical protein